MSRRMLKTRVLWPLISWSLLLIFSYAIAQTADPDSLRFKDEVAAFEKYDRKNSFLKNQILFVGSSSIRMWPTAESFPDMYVINRGFGGSHLSDLLYYYETLVKKYQPAKIVLYEGDNDVAGNKSPEQIFADYREFVARIKRDLPKTKLYYLPIKPSISRWFLWDVMKQTNMLIKDFNQSDPQLFYVDTATPMLDETGKPGTDLFLEDGLHMNEKGYAIWNETLLPFLSE